MLGGGGIGIIECEGRKSRQTGSDITVVDGVVAVDLGASLPGNVRASWREEKGKLCLRSGRANKLIMQ